MNQKKVSKHRLNHPKNSEKLRKTMNQNSLDAYESIKPERPTLHRKIVSALHQIGEGSFRDIARKANLVSHQVSRRVSELEKIGHIVKVGDKKCEVSGRKVSVYALPIESE